MCQPPRYRKTLLAAAWLVLACFVGVCLRTSVSLAEEHCTEQFPSTQESEGCWLVTSQCVAARVDKAKGAVTALELPRGRYDCFLGRDARVFICDVSKSKTFDLHQHGDFQRQECKTGEDIAEIRTDFDLVDGGFDIRQRVFAHRDKVEWKLEIGQSLDTDREISVTFKLPCPRDWSCFAANSFSPFKLNTAGRQSMLYGNALGTALPAVTIYSAKEDLGLTIARPFDMRTPHLVFETDPETSSLVVRFSNLRLQKSEKVCVGLVFLGHEGDWRAGLGRLRAIFPDYFPDPVRLPAEGLFQTPMFWNWNEEYMRLTTSRAWEWNENAFRSATKTFGAKITQYHMYCPHYGLYLPDEDRWKTVHWLESSKPAEWLEKNVGWMDRKKMKDHIALFRRFDQSVLLYYQFWECWKPMAGEQFETDICLNYVGKPEFPHVWRLCHLMNPDPESKWGRHCQEQAAKLLGEFPEANGLLVDRLDYQNLDFAHQDGITMRGGKPCYAQTFAAERALSQLADLAHSRRKALWANDGHLLLEQSRHLDGFMVEAHLFGLFNAMYLVTRPIVFRIPQERLARPFEDGLKLCLLAGAFPYYRNSDWSEEDIALYRKYVPMLEHYVGRELVLHPHAVTIPDELANEAAFVVKWGKNGERQTTIPSRCNIFRDPNGRYLVPLVSPERAVDDKRPPRQNIEVVVRVPDADVVRRAYEVSPDFSEQRELTIRRTSQSMTVVLPTFQSASLIVLSK